jgi:hypothetical protein
MIGKNICEIRKEETEKYLYQYRAFTCTILKTGNTTKERIESQYYKLSREYEKKTVAHSEIKIKKSSYPYHGTKSYKQL